MLDFIASGHPNAAEVGRLVIGVAYASGVSLEARESRVEIIHIAFQAAGPASPMRA
jgi:hypothetical protein